ncbi:c-type cytochrome biogenesis protein CcmI [Gilvimarinus agarilyticus]|uniref:c-type cytochrome biogenesis protein CcmI n=1 Tax=Gilvimarinus sp. 2_MG-2023 TaxID=3062666 RepID=UPI001C09A470|nr:c-type cytochrome biogenesis protein CcmI [Gilvimarinus sp. 2_MG-2023]MBU2887121.1 c-type cytochrome biogenesis protein CcmI [Gilvimarinus agarilyticus]MDO6571780.1 c-type cytochrome biogenesis protein CcmI [Gilvimarinus sp. 2_MG-2023]
MTLFMLGAAALLLIALITLLWPLCRHRRSSDAVHIGEQEREAQNIALYLEHLKEVDADLDRGRINQEQHLKLVTELKRNLLSDHSTERRSSAHSSGLWVLSVSAIIMAGVCVWLYLAQGSIGDALFVKLQKRVAEHNVAAMQAGRQPDIGPTTELIELLQERVKTRSDNPQYWYLLGRYANQVGRYELAVEGFRGAYDISPNDPGIASQLAQALFFVEDNQITDEIRFLIERALESDPEDTTALGLAGINAFSSQDYAAAIEHWQSAVDLTPVGASGRQALMAGINRAKQELGTEPDTETNATWKLPIEVSLAPNLSLPDSGTVFVLVREHNGSPMPLAVQRLQLTEFPLSIILDETMAMTTKSRLHANGPLEVVARVSLAGTAAPQPGDLQGSTAPVDMSKLADPVQVVIDQTL